MATIVLVHGAFEGEWLWDFLTPLLVARGHTVRTPTLSGLGKRYERHQRRIGARTHATELANLITRDPDEHITLVAHSYAGIVTAGAWSRIRERIDHLVLLDALIPTPGLRMTGKIIAATPPIPDWLLGWSKPIMRDMALKQHVAAPPLPFFGITDPKLRAWAQPQLTPTPATLLQGMSRFPPPDGVDTTFVHCTTSDAFVLRMLRPSATYAQRHPDWDYIELATGHSCMLNMPDRVAEIIFHVLDNARILQPSRIDDDFS